MQNNLKDIRLKRGLTQKQVAEMFGFDNSQDRISMWEQGIATPNLANLFKLIRFYKVDSRDIYPDL